LAEKAGVIPEALALGIAAGYCFDPAEDALAVSLQDQLKKDGLDAVLTAVSGIQPGELLAKLVSARYQALRKEGF
jgi:hypothetical protein